MRSRRSCTPEVKPGLMAGQELSQTSCPNTPLLKKDANKGNGKGKGAPLGQLKNLAGGVGANVVNAFGKLSGNKRGSGVN